MIESFSFAPKYIPLIEQAKECAKEDGMSYSELVLSLHQDYIHRNNKKTIATTTATQNNRESSESEIDEEEEEDLTNLVIKPTRISVKEFRKWNSRIQASDNMGFLEKTANGFNELSQQCYQLSNNASSRAEAKRRIKQSNPSSPSPNSRRVIPP